MEEKLKLIKDEIEGRPAGVVVLLRRSQNPAREGKGESIWIKCISFRKGVTSIFVPAPNLGADGSLASKVVKQPPEQPLRCFQNCPYLLQVSLCSKLRSFGLFFSV